MNCRIHPAYLVLSAFLFSGLSLSAGAQNINLTPNEVTDGALPSGYSAINFSTYDGNWVPKVKLPAQPGNRSRVTISSQAAYATQIDDVGVGVAGTMQLNRGDEYQFLYVSELGKWQLVKSPETVYQAGQVTDGQLPAMIRPRAVVSFSDGNFVPNLTLPRSAKAGDRVIVKSDAGYTFNVLTGIASFPVSKGETVAFRVNSAGNWEKETVTIDLLFVYSDKAADKVGESVVRSRIVEGFNMTNEALENSGANFRYRMVGLRKIAAPGHWIELGHPLVELRDDPLVQGWRNELRADGLYYVGTESGCGVAWINVAPSAYNMIGAESAGCGVAVMRHELGHNMGLRDYDGLSGTIMAGNEIPYYPTPYRYTSDGTSMDGPDRLDGVKEMNARSAAVAGFR